MLFRSEDGNEITSNETEAETNIDYIYVNGTTYTGKELANKTVHINGDTLTVRLVSDGSDGAYGFSIDSIIANYLVHEYTDTVVAPTCTEQGYTTHTCACGESHVDEAYVDFGCDSAVKLIPEYENLLVVHTFSKSRSLAGMRIGFAYGNENLIAALNAVKNSINSYTLDRLALAAAQAAVEDKAYFDDTRQAIIKIRETATGKLRELGFTVLPSQANFVFAAHETVPGKVLFRRLREGFPWGQVRDSGRLPLLHLCHLGHGL